WPVLISEVVESLEAVEEEDTEAAVVVDPGLVEDIEVVEDIRVVEAASEALEGFVAAGVDSGGVLVGVDLGGLVDTEALMGVEDTEEVEEDMEGGDSEEAGGETEVVFKAEHLNKDIFE
ncbi:hypothetical protein M9458_004191, partial [Cirrhinus mrigala]